MRVLVTGRQGQLTRSLAERATDFPLLELITAARPQVDLEQPGSLAAGIRALRPDLVINAAAYTAVDQAEAEPERAFRINADAAGEGAEAAAEVGAPFIQLSTDYVFDGSGTRPYREDDPTNPLGIYGASKLAGEEAVRRSSPDHLILRTSWVYSPFGRNFVKTMLALAETGDDVRVVADQHGCPTSALDLADAVLRLADARRRCNYEGWGRTYHLAGTGSCTWAEFAAEIFRTSRSLGGPTAEVLPIASAEYPTPAARPKFSVLDANKFADAFGFTLADWKSSLGTVVGRTLRPTDSQGTERSD